MSKKVIIEPRPQDLERWVSERTLPKAPEKIKRLTIDLPESLHKKLKLRAIEEDKAMVDLIRELLQAKLGG
jgi:hypothetical protein